MVHRFDPNLFRSEPPEDQRMVEKLFRGWEMGLEYGYDILNDHMSQFHNISNLRELITKHTKYGEYH